MSAVLLIAAVFAAFCFGVTVGDISVRWAEKSLVDIVRTRYSWWEQTREMRRDLKRDDAITRKLNQ